MTIKRYAFDSRMAGIWNEVSRGEAIFDGARNPETVVAP